MCLDCMESRRDPLTQKYKDSCFIAIRGSKLPVTDRPADLLQPEMEKAREETKGLARDIGDVLTYALYSNIGKEFLKKKYSSEASVPK